MGIERHAPLRRDAGRCGGEATLKNAAAPVLWQATVEARLCQAESAAPDIERPASCWGDAGPPPRHTGPTKNTPAPDVMQEVCRGLGTERPAPSSSTQRGAVPLLWRALLPNAPQRTALWQGIVGGARERPAPQFARARACCHGEPDQNTAAHRGQHRPCPGHREARGRWRTRGGRLSTIRQDEPSRPGRAQHTMPRGWAQRDRPGGRPVCSDYLCVAADTLLVTTARSFLR